MRSLGLSTMMIILCGCTSGTFVGEWSPDKRLQQAGLSGFHQYRVVINANGTSTVNALVVDNITTQPAVIIADVRAHGIWKRVSDDSAELVLDGQSERAVVRLIDNDHLVISEAPFPSITLHRDR